jgi:hypothetical protein
MSAGPAGAVCGAEAGGAESAGAAGWSAGCPHATTLRHSVKMTNVDLMNRNIALAIGGDVLVAARRGQTFSSPPHTTLGALDIMPDAPSARAFL